MKKKLFISALTVIIFILCTIGIVACTTTTQSNEHTHSWGKYTSDGVTTHTHTCKCGESATESHNWNGGEITKTATCQETGVKTYTCADCGETKTETLEISNNHAWGKWTTDGENTHTHVCSVCEKRETESHKWDNGVITKQANCKDTGIKTYTCPDCGETKTEVLEKTEIHTWSKWTSIGYDNHSRTCSTCGEAQTATHNMVGETCSDCGYASVPATIIGVDNAEIDFAASTIKMLVNKTTNSVNLSNMVKVSLNSSWKLYTADSNLIATKFANLNDGENSFLIVVTSSDGIYDNTYTLNIYKSFEVSVKYYNVYNSVIHTETADTGYKFTVDYTPDITGYTFNYWKLNNEQTTEFIPFGAISLYADCTANSYNITLNPDGGEVAETSKQVTFDSSYSLPVPTKTGHTFTGWYLENTKITNAEGASIKNSKFATATELIANWQVNSYKLTVEYDDYSHGSVKGGGTYDYNTSVTVTAITKTGYTFIGWYNGETLLDGNLSYTFAMPAEAISYTAKWCKISTASNNTTAGTVNELNGTYIAGAEVELTATTKAGYAFIGWFNGEILLSNDLIYSVIMPSVDTVFTAKWCEVIVEVNNSNAGTCYINGDYIAGSEVELTAITNLGYDWLGWFDCETLLTTDLNYTLTMPDKDTIYTAKWQVKIEMQIFYFSSNSTTCIINGLKDETLTEVTMPDYVTTIGERAFYDCSGLTSVIIGNSVTTIGERAFYNCSGLTSVTIPDSVISIGGSAFYNCSGLTSVIIGNSVTTIGSYAFENCSGLTSITIPDSVTSIGSYAFSGCELLEYNEYDNGLYLGNEYNKFALLVKAKDINITSCEINQNTKLIGGSAFYNCSGLTSITIPDSVISIGGSAFSYCSELTSITIPDSVISIGGFAFSSCSRLTSVIIGNSVTTIGERAFYNCSGLTSVTIPDSVTTIGGYAFYGCSKMTIYCEATSKPSGWVNYWNCSFESDNFHAYHPVVWDCKNKG